MAVAEILKGLNAVAIRDVAARHGATDVRVFGSFARGTQQRDSDLDLLGRRVDVVTTRSLSPYLRDSVLKDAISL